MAISDNNKQLEDLRNRLNLIDNQIIELLEKRLESATKIADVKDKLNLPLTDSQREKEIITRLKKSTKNLVLQETISDLYQNIFSLSKIVRNFKKDSHLPFSKIGIIGLGLIGGSIAKTIKNKNKAIKIYTLKRNSPNNKLAINDQMLDHEFDNLKDLIQNTELIILASDIGSIIPLAKDLAKFKNELQHQILIMDVASVKEKISSEFEKLTNHQIEFIAAHPMSGSEKSGFDAASSILFINNPWIITPHKKNTIQAVDNVEKLIKFLGANVIKLDANIHDKLVAKVSHLVFLLSIYLFDYVQGSKEALNIAGSGFKTMTRLAHGNKLMHNQILSENNGNIKKELKEFINFINTTSLRTHVKQSH